ncbi:hypothetical protein ACFE04_027536 [Oxalis oulophora]
MARFVILIVQSVLLLVAMVFSMSESRFYPFKKYHVLLVDNLPDSDELDIQCTSDKIGNKDQTLNGFGQTFEFGFREDYFGSISFNCNLWYYSGDQEHHVNFNAFANNKHFITSCGDTCKWTVTVEGIHFYNADKGEDELFYQWDN